MTSPRWRVCQSLSAMIGASVAAGNTFLRIMSAARSASMIVGPFRSPAVACGMIEASTTRRFCTPITRQSGVYHGQRIGTHPAGSAGVIGTFDFSADEIIKGRIRLRLWPRSKLRPGVGGHGRFGKDLAGKADARAHFLPVVFMGHVV